MTKTFDHGGGVRSVRVPIPDNPLGYTLVYVVDTDRGPVLVDTGWDDPASWAALSDGLRACGTSVAEVYGVVITHHHPDHHGLSGQVREASGAWVAMHPADAAARGIADGQRVRVFNGRGRTLIPARVTDRVAPGVVSIKEGAWFALDADGQDTRGCSNLLTDDRSSPAQGDE